MGGASSKKAQKAKTLTPLQPPAEPVPTQRTPDSGPLGIAPPDDPDVISVTLETLPTDTGEWVKNEPQHWTDTNDPAELIYKTSPLGASNAIWSTPLKKLFNTYFEITIEEDPYAVSLSKSFFFYHYSLFVVMIGVCPKASQPTRIDEGGMRGGCWALHKKPGARDELTKGDVVGWGINKHGKLFWTFNGDLSDRLFAKNKVPSTDSTDPTGLLEVPNEFPTLYPFIATNVCSSFFLDFHLIFVIVWPRSIQDQC